MRLDFDNPENAPRPAGPYSQVARLDLGGTAGALLILSGQVALDDDGAVIGPGDLARQSRVVLEGISALLSAHGASLADVAHIRTCLLDMSQLADYAGVRREFFPGTPPASTTVEVSGLFRPGLLIEIEVTAAVPADRGGPRP
jgi:2-iminobutanoate/2-iminopropanoate deaminase